MGEVIIYMECFLNEVLNGIYYDCLCSLFNALWIWQYGLLRFSVAGGLQQSKAMINYKKNRSISADFGYRA